MKVTGIKTFICDVFRANWVVLKVTTDEGIHGVGEATLEHRELAATLARFLVKQWGEDPRQRPFAADIQLTRLALQGEELAVLRAVASYGVQGLEETFRYGDAVAMGEAAVRVLEKGVEPVPPLLLRRLSDVSARVGQVKEAVDFIRRALAALEAGMATGGETEEYAFASMSYGRLLTDLGEPGQALELFERARSFFDKEKNRRTPPPARSNWKEDDSAAS